MIAVYSCIAVLTVVAAYVYGCSRTRMKWIEQRDNYRDIILDHGKMIREWTAAFHEEQKKKVEWFSKYTALQQEIECHIHETHEESERPHVEQIWPVDKSSFSRLGHQDLVFEDEDEQQFLDSIYKKQDKDIDHRVPGSGC